MTIYNITFSRATRQVAEVTVLAKNYDEAAERARDELVESSWRHARVGPASISYYETKPAEFKCPECGNDVHVWGSGGHGSAQLDEDGGFSIEAEFDSISIECAADCGWEGEPHGKYMERFLGPDPECEDEGEAEKTVPRFAEHDMVVTTAAVGAEGKIHGTGTRGAVVDVHQGGDFYTVEFDEGVVVDIASSFLAPAEGFAAAPTMRRKIDECLGKDALPRAEDCESDKGKDAIEVVEHIVGAYGLGLREHDDIKLWSDGRAAILLRAYRDKYRG